MIRYSCCCDSDIIALHIQAQNAAIIIRRRPTVVVFEVFEVSPMPDAVMDVAGKLICSYPGPAVEIPLAVAQDTSFVEQLGSFLEHMHNDRLDAVEAKTVKAGSKVPETRGTTHPRYISQLFAMILSGTGVETNIERIAKRIADDVCYNKGKNPWRRSSLWLVLRVACQTSAPSRDLYKAFMLYHQIKLLHLFHDHNFSSDVLHVARVKTSRRLAKLGSAAPEFVVQELHSVSCGVERLMQERWSQEQTLQSTSPSFTPEPSTFEQDTIISLHNSRSYLTKILRPDTQQHNLTAFTPSHYPRIRDTRDFHELVPDGLTRAVQGDSYIALADFECVVHERLGDWVSRNQLQSSASTTLGSCLEQYTSVARTWYSSNPEDESIMLLTIMWLWVALDTVVIAQCPLLSSYSPEIPSNILTPLLLRRAEYIERAADIEVYLRKRHSAITYTTSIFSNRVESNSFPIRYYRNSSSLCSLKAEIEADAHIKRNAKRNELNEKNARHAYLLSEAYRRNCSYARDSYGCSYHAYDCYKCKLQAEARGLRIAVHEWPLSSNYLEAEATVFELQCPKFFAIWRANTYRIVRDLGMANSNSSSARGDAYLLEDYEGLTQWSQRGTSGRIVFASTTKSFLNSHYRDTAIPTVEGSVCVNNGLQYEPYDTFNGEYVRAVLPFRANLDSYGTLRLPEDPDRLYSYLQYAISYTKHSHNETIVSQEDCPKNLSLHEHAAFSNLRCGALLQWKNIVRELRANVLTFGREEVHTLLSQAAWQVGPLEGDGVTRPWHYELTIPEFGALLVREGEDLLSRVEANWLEGITVKSMGTLSS